MKMATMALALFSILVVIAPDARAQAAGRQAFDQGTAAFRAGDYNAALAAFLRAERAGLRTAGLRYNLGVTYYRLRRFPEAQREFTELARDPAWAPLANYNLGLTAQRLGQDQRARVHYRRARDTTTEPKLRALAATALARLEPASPAPRTTAAVSLGGGYDSNVTLTSDAATVGVADDGDLFVEAVGVLLHRFNGDAARGFHLHGGAYARQHLDLDQFDQVGIRAGISRDSDSARWQTSLGGFLDLAYVDGDELVRIATFDAQARRRFAAGRDARARFQFSGVEGGSGFGYLDGWQQRLLIDAGLPVAGGRLRLGYQLELNDREDLEAGGEFFSYSPTRHALLASYAWSPAEGWRLNARGEYRASRYNDPNRVGGDELTREEDRYLFGVRADRRLDNRWRLFVDYSYTSNDSNFSAYDYSRHQLMGGVEATLH